MAYIGKRPLIGNYQICDALTASATADYTLQVGGVNVSPQSANAMIVSLNSVIQAPGASGGFTVSGSTISFNSALTSSDVINFIYILGDVLDIGTPTDGSVSAAKLAADSVTTAKILDNNVTLAKLADGTQGDILYYGASGAPTLLGYGTSGDFLKTQGTGANPVWATVTTTDISWQSVVTASTLTATAGNGYWIDTSSNTCTITLPASASNGDQIIFSDYARNWATNGIIIDSNGLNYQGDDDSFTVEYSTDGQSVHIVYADATQGWIPITDDDVADVPSLANDNGIFGYGQAPSDTAYTNTISNTGVASADITGVGTARAQVMGCEYGGDKGIFAYGNDGGSYVSMSNLVSNAGVVSADVTGVGTARAYGAGCHYGGDKGIIAYGYTGSTTAVSNLVTNAGVIGSDVTGVGTARFNMGACEYGDDKGIFGYGDDRITTHVSITNLVTNAGVIGTDVSGVGTARDNLAACSYGDDKGIFGYGYLYLSMTNLVSNTGVVGADVTGVGTGRYAPAACEYGKDKGIFGWGDASGGVTAVTNLVSNAGVVATDTAGVGTAGYYRGACSYN